MINIRKIDLPEKCRIICVSDIHAHYDEFARLLRKCDYNNESDYLFILGDILPASAARTSPASASAWAQSPARTTIWPTGCWASSRPTTPRPSPTAAPTSQPPQSSSWTASWVWRRASITGNPSQALTRQIPLFVAYATSSPGRGKSFLRGGALGRPGRFVPPAESLRIRRMPGLACGGRCLVDNAPCQAVAVLGSRALPFPIKESSLVSQKPDRHASGSPHGRAGIAQR